MYYIYYKIKNLYIRFTTKLYQPLLHLIKLFITYQSYIVQYIYIDYIHPHLHYIRTYEYYYNNGNSSFAYHTRKKRDLNNFCDIWIIVGGTVIFTVSVAKITVRTVKYTGAHRNFSSATSNYLNVASNYSNAVHLTVWTVIFATNTVEITVYTVLYSTVKCTGTHRNFSSARSSYSNAVFCV